MKTRLIFLLLIILFYCKKEEIIPTPILQFAVESDHVTEGKDVTVKLTLDTPAQQNGIVVLAVLGTAKYNENYSTSPPLENDVLTLQILKGDKEIQFKVNAINNVKVDGENHITFSINNSAGFRIGKNFSFTLEILDYDEQVIANFSAGKGSIFENNANGFGVDIQFTGVMSVPGSVTVSIASSNAVLDKDYTVDKNIANNKVTLDISQGSNQVSFKIFPKNDEVAVGDKTIDFSISEVSGMVKKGTNFKFTLTILDDEDPSSANFSVDKGRVFENTTDGFRAILQTESGKASRLVRDPYDK